MGISTKLKLFSSFFITIFLSGCAKEIIEENKIQTTVAAQLQNKQNIAYLSLLFDKIEYVLYVNDKKIILQINLPNLLLKMKVYGYILMNISVLMN